MFFDVFFSISQTPVDGFLPTEDQMWRSFFEQVQAADELGYGCAWVAMSHLSTEVQKQHRQPVVPHWKGEVGLNNDIFQLAPYVFARTRRIELGSAIVNLLCNGGPIARAEQVATFASLHGLDPAERRRLRLGFSGGRFDFMARAYGVGPRDPVEELAWPVLKGLVFAEACQVFLRLLDGQIVSSDQLAPPVLQRSQFRSDQHWSQVKETAAACGYGRSDEIELRRRYDFEPARIVPRYWRRELVDLVLGSHDPALQVEVNRILPVKVFNLSITQPEVIDQTHARMTQAYHPTGGPWRREYMPRTVMVFVNGQAGLSDAARSTAAQAEAAAALGAYWTALEGTIDPAKVAHAADNAVIGNPEEVAAQVAQRFHPDDRLMLWFDFFNHDSARVMENMRVFVEQVAPRVAELQARRGGA